PNGVDTKRCRPAGKEKRSRLRVAYGVAPGAVVVTAVARLTPHKRIDLLLGAAASLAESGANLRLWVVGSGGERDRLTSLAHRLGVGVEFTGSLSAEAVLER